MCPNNLTTPHHSLAVTRPFILSPVYYASTPVNRNSGLTTHQLTTSHAVHQFMSSQRQPVCQQSVDSSFTFSTVFNTVVVYFPNCTSNMFVIFLFNVPVQCQWHGPVISSPRGFTQYGMLTPVCGLRWFRWYFMIGLHPLQVVKACQNHLRSPITHHSFWDYIIIIMHYYYYYSYYYYYMICLVPMHVHG